MNNLRILKRNKKFFIQSRFLLFFWKDLKENNNPAYDTSCPPFDTVEQAREWLTIYIRFRTEVIYPVHKIALSFHH